MWQFFSSENRKIWNQISTIRTLRKTINLTSLSSFALLFEHKLIFHLDSRSSSVQIISNKVSSHWGNFKNPGKQSGRNRTTILLGRSRLYPSILLFPKNIANDVFDHMDSWKSVENLIVNSFFYDHENLWRIEN